LRLLSPDSDSVLLDALLEDSGYLARGAALSTAALLFGLHGDLSFRCFPASRARFQLFAARTIPRDASGCLPSGFAVDELQRPLPV